MSTLNRPVRSKFPNCLQFLSSQEQGPSTPSSQAQRMNRRQTAVWTGLASPRLPRFPPRLQARCPIRVRNCQAGIPGGFKTQGAKDHIWGHTAPILQMRRLRRSPAKTSGPELEPESLSARCGSSRSAVSAFPPRLQLAPRTPTRDRGGPA